MSHLNGAAIRVATLFLTTSLLMAGCSSSSDSPALTEGDNIVSNIDSVAGTAQPEADPISSEANDEVIVSADEPVEETSELVAPISENTPAETTSSEQNSEPATEAVPDPLVQNRTQVDFGITVPAYQSDALQVRLTWGDIDVTAGWVGDELWSTSLDLPTDTESTLLVTFSDSNGDIVLASFEQAYRTGSNAAEAFNIAAEQFNSEQWDADNDGTSNLNELIAGSNPFSNEALQLEVRESYFVNTLIPVSSYYEQSISEERPYSFQIEELPPADASFNSDRRTHIVTIEIDEFGNGTVSDRFRFAGAADRDITVENQEATRTNTGSSILWAGTYERTNSGAAVGDEIDFSIETRSVSDVTRKQDGTVSRHNYGMSNGSFEQELVYSLIGNRLNDSTGCQAISGTITDEISYTAFANSRPDTVTTVSKESDDIYWFVEVASTEGDVLESYLAMSLTPNFYCDMGDI